MAPVEDLVKRYWSSCPSGYYLSGGNCYRSKWYSWGRWVVLAIAIGLFFIVLLSCLSIARRRRRRGVQPMYGTGWMAPQPGKWGNQNQHQMNDYNQQGYQNYPPPGGDFQQQPAYGGYPPAPPPPAYGQQQPQYTGSTFNTNEGYYATAATAGQQQSGVQPPHGTYQREEVYSPPQGPPPGKH